jgi:hypothetical protein
MHVSQLGDTSGRRETMIAGIAAPSSACAVPERNLPCPRPLARFKTSKRAFDVRACETRSSRVDSSFAFIVRSAGTLQTIQCDDHVSRASPRWTGP